MSSVLGCTCRDGFVRDYTGACIDPSQCACPDVSFLLVCIFIDKNVLNTKNYKS